ncbi:hypothetical protein P8936_06885 [Edaphobacter paludis]|uniref:Uncharacterized protein n=1 Tax=Edaphobacter paludis TaxID=3035702 RepID=A0AAU7DCM0_9BACT
MKDTKPMKMWAALALGAAMILSGCHSAPPAGTKNADGSITNPDGSVTYPAGTKPAVATRNADGSITNPDGSVTYPAGTAPAQAAKQEAPTPAASTAAPAPEAAPVAPTSVATVVPSGTIVRVSISETLSAKRNNVGDSFSGVLSEPLRTRGGGSLFKRGTRVTGTVVASKGQGRFKGAGDLGIQLTSIAGIPVQTSEFEQVAKGKGKRTAVMAGGGTGLGAIIGGIAGGGKGALIGGLAGAGAGTAGSAFTGNKDVVIPAESQITFRLTSPLTVR